MRQVEGPIKRTIIWIIIIGGTIWMLFPFYWAVSNSIKPKIETFNPEALFPFINYQPSLWAWDKVFSQGDPIKPLINSAVVSVATTGIVLIVGTMAAYALARYRWRIIKSNDLTVWFLSQRVLPPVVVLIPFFIIMMKLHLLDTWRGLILVYVTFNLPFGVVIMREMFRDIPVELEEAALIDGASDWQTFTRVSLPLAVNGLVATAIIVFAFAWNEALFALTLTSAKAGTMPVYILSARSTRGVLFNVASVNTLLAIAPPVILALTIQRYLVRGLTFGAVKE